LHFSFDSKNSIAWHEVSAIHRASHPSKVSGLDLAAGAVWKLQDLYFFTLENSLAPFAIEAIDSKRRNTFIIMVMFPNFESIYEICADAFL
jgi:hypothetical protein